MWAVILHEVRGALWHPGVRGLVGGRIVRYCNQRAVRSSRLQRTTIRCNFEFKTRYCKLKKVADEYSYKKNNSIYISINLSRGGLSQLVYTVMYHNGAIIARNHVVS